MPGKMNYVASTVRKRFEKASPGFVGGAEKGESKHVHGGGPLSVTTKRLFFEGGRLKRGRVGRRLPKSWGRKGQSVWAQH